MESKMADMRETLVDWLRDAHGMEKQAIDMMEAHSGRLEHYPELKAQIDRHIAETRGQVQRLEDCLGRLGADTSAVKTGLARASGMMQSLLGSAASDEVVKNAIGEASFERFEIANYRVLIAAAEACGEMEVKRLCEESLREEEAMASWLDQQLPIVTKRYLGMLETAGTSAAKR
jgi:ferritin-like metal-binding protein YciE